MMKKFLAQMSGAFAASQYAIGTAFAQLPPPDEIPGLPDQANIPQIKTLIVDLIKVVLDFILLIAVVYVIIAGIRLIVSGGDEGQKDKAKTTIIYVIIGIIFRPYS
jgi:hypothetical protein